MADNSSHIERKQNQIKPHTKTNEFLNLTFEAFEQTVTTQNPSWLFGDKDIQYHGHWVVHVHASVIRMYATK